MYTVEVQFKTKAPAFEAQIYAATPGMAKEKAKSMAKASGFNDPVKKIILRG